MNRILDNIDLPERIVQKKGRQWNFHKWGMAYEDLIGAAIEGLIIADRDFDEKRGKPFRTFAYIVILRTIISEIRRYDPVPSSQRKRIINGEMQDVKFSILFENAHKDPANSNKKAIQKFHDKCFLNSLITNLKTLTNAERRRMTEHYINGVSQNQIARNEKRCRGSITNSIRDALKKMRGASQETL